MIWVFSSSPKRPSSPACGLSPHTAMRARGRPRPVMVCCASRMTRPTRSRVTRSGTRRSATWVVTWMTLSSLPIRSIAKSFVSVSRARISVWPGVLDARGGERLLVDRARSRCRRSRRPGRAARRSRCRRRRRAPPRRSRVDLGSVAQSTFARSKHSSRPGSNVHSATDFTACRVSGERRSASVAAITERSPMTTGRHAAVTSGCARALAVISGPTPAGSPMVMPSTGTRAAVTRFLPGSWRGDRRRRTRPPW